MTDKKIKNIKIVAYIYDIVEIIFLFILFISFYLALPIKSSSVIFVPKGSITHTLSYLKKNNFQITPLDNYILPLIGKPQSGWIDIEETHLSKGDFLYKLTTSKAALKSTTLIPGETLYFFIKQLGEDFNLSRDKLQSEYDKISPYTDGVIIADTYKVPLGIKEEHLMYYLVNDSLNQHKRWSTKILGEYDEKQWFRFVTIASIIQKEAAGVDEFALVSAVIHNRLKKRMRLQMDGTLNYGLYSHTPVTARRIKYNSSPYNTYKIDGLPPSPIGSVNFNAIKAAISPADVDYLFFVKDRNGSHNFSKSYKTHLKNINSGNN